MFAPANMAEEQKPCATIIINPPSIPIMYRDKNPIITSPIWTTEEYAIKTFRSLWVKQINLNKADPIKLIDSTNLKIGVLLKNKDMRINPYPPNFNKTPANNIEPDTGASTWAFGNHMWK